MVSEEHKLIEKMVYDFTRREVMPIIKDYDRSHDFPMELARRMGELSFLGICLPVRYDGGGMDYISLGIVSEGLEFGDSSLQETLARARSLYSNSII